MHKQCRPLNSQACDLHLSRSIRFQTPQCAATRTVMTTISASRQRIRGNSECERLQERVIDSLKQSGYSALKNVECRVEDGTVELQGAVPTFFLKQMAQAIALRCKGVAGIENSLLVQ